MTADNEPPHDDRASLDTGAPAAPELEKLRAEREELLAQLQRARADYQNLRKRTQVDIDNSVRRSLESLLQSLFLVVDNLDLALAAPGGCEDAHGLARGVQLTRDQLLGALAQEGARPIPESAEFDPRLHEAVASVESTTCAAGSVVASLRRGWTWRGQVVRPAHVQVAAAPKEQADEATTD